MVSCIFSHSGYITDTLDISPSFIQLINPNTASYEELSQIPFLSDREIELIMRERRDKPFRSIDDLSQRIGLLPFETTYLNNIFYFNHQHTFYAYCVIDTSFYYRASLFLKNRPVASIWKQENRTLFMSAVHTAYFSLYQGYVLPVFKGGLSEPSTVIRRKNGLKMDTTYNFGIMSKNFIFFHTPYNNLLKIYSSPYSFFLARGEGPIKELYTVSLDSRCTYIETGFINKKAVFYLAGYRKSGKNTTFLDIYSRYIDYRIYGGHIYSRHKIGKYYSIKTYASYKHTHSGLMRFSTTLQFHLPQKHVFLNIGFKKTYSNSTRVYISSGKYGKNYAYLSITKSLGSPSYLMRYSMGFYGLSLSYIISAGNEEYVFLDDTKDGYFLGSIKNRLKVGYRMDIKGIKAKVYYIVNQGETLLQFRLQGRFSY